KLDSRISVLVSCAPVDEESRETQAGYDKKGSGTPPREPSGEEDDPEDEGQREGQSFLVRSWCDVTDPAGQRPPVKKAARICSDLRGAQCGPRTLPRVRQTSGMVNVIRRDPTWRDPPPKPSRCSHTGWREFLYRRRRQGSPEPS